MGRMIGKPRGLKIQDTLRKHGRQDNKEDDLEDDPDKPEEREFRT
jgi:hypothetical protein